MSGAGGASVCTISVGEQRFGIETAALGQVVLSRGMRRVPLGPAFCCGVLAYRGEVLTVVGMRRLLGLPDADAGCVLVIEDDGERFGLLVDGVGAVVEVERGEPIPGGGAGNALFGEVWRLDGDLLVKLDPAQVRPGRLGERLVAMGSAGSGQEAA